LQARLDAQPWLFFRAQISLRDLGGLETWWSALGTGNRSETARDAVGQYRFRVSEAFEVMLRACEPDSRDRLSVDYFVKQDALGLLTPRITLICEDLADGSNFLIADGNHQAVAIYERRRQTLTSRIPVYLIGEAP
jgi:hypothetical protein